MATSPSICDSRIPTASATYCEQFTPATMALMCEACALQLKLGRMVSIDQGFIWAAVRAVQRDEASSPVLARLTPEHVEESYRRMFREFPGPLTADRVEKSHSMNMLCVLPPRCTPNERRLDFVKPVTPGVLLAEIVAKFDYAHGSNVPLYDVSRDMRAIAEAFQAPDGFVSNEALTKRGTIENDKMGLYRTACDKAAFAGTWLVRDFHVAAAASELDLPIKVFSDRKALLKKWEGEIQFARKHVSAGGCVWLVSFPGRRPWTPSACKLLGVESVVDSIYAAATLRDA